MQETLGGERTGHQGRQGSSLSLNNLEKRAQITNVLDHQTKKQNSTSCPQSQPLPWLLLLYITLPALKLCANGMCSLCSFFRLLSPAVMFVTCTLAAAFGRCLGFFHCSVVFHFQF